MDSPYSASELAAKIRCGELSPVDVVDDCLDRIHARNDEVNAVVTTLDESAREQARKAAKAVEDGDALGPLHGVPVLIKDLFGFKKGVRNTFGSSAFQDFVPDQDAVFVKRLEEAGAIIVGKTNTSEFGLLGTTDNPLFGATSTPFDTDRNAGGSSGGSAAAVATGMVPIAQGSDAGGSIRIPSAWCGVYGFKPSFGRVPQVNRPDAFVSHTPFVHTGPITRTVEDAALALQVMEGPHPRDPLSFPETETDLIAAVREGIQDMDIAYSPDLGVFEVDNAIGSVTENAIETFERAGASVKQIELDFDLSQQKMTELQLQQIGVIYHSMLEGFEQEGTNLIQDYRDELTPEFVSLIDELNDFSVRDYKRNNILRTRIYDSLQEIFEGYDLLVTPTVSVPPVKNNVDGITTGPTELNGKGIEPIIGWALTFPVNFSGHPAASVPAGLTSDQLPVGLQIVGNHFDDASVLAASGVIERARPWKKVLNLME